MAKRAASSRLAPGETSIDRVTPTKTGTGYSLKWSVCTHDGQLLRKTSTGSSKGAARANARAKAKELLTTPGTATWKPSSPMGRYLEAVTWPAMHAARLEASTVRRYELAYRLLRGECSQPECVHSHGLTGLSVSMAMKPRTLKACLEEIAQLHGEKNVKHAKLVASRYVAGPLMLDDLLSHNPLRDLSLDLAQAREPDYHRGGKALSREQYQSVISYLFAADPYDVERPKRGRWSYEHRVMERATAIDIVLAQATTGMRISELCLRPVAETAVDENATFIFKIPAEATKTRHGRDVPVLHASVSHRLAARRSAGSPWLFPSASDPQKLWDPRSRDRHLARLYEEMAEALGIEVLRHERGHLWRSTLNTRLYHELPESVRTRLLGHTPAVNRSHYTAETDTEHVVQAAAGLFHGLALEAST